MIRLSLLIGLIAWCLAGCQSDPVVLPAAQVRSAIEPRLVKLYLKPPKKYELLGNLQVTDHLQYGQEFSIDPALDALIAQAAAKGGNGLLLAMEQPAGAQHVIRGGYYRNTFVHVVVRIRPGPPAVIAQAIYVLED